MLICTNEDCGTENRDEATYCTKCGSLLLKVVGAYRVLDLIGQGANGAVYRAEHCQRPGEIRALKAVFKRTDIASLKAELEVLKNLHHPNLPRYDAWFEHQGYGYLVMEFVPGQNLAQLLDQRRGPLSPTLVLGYALQLCDVLTFLHTQPQRILHRDIKPANIRLTHTDVVKLVDFGLLKQGTDATRQTQRGRGTLAYMPIEQYGSGTDARSDLYSLGATLYHLLTGHEPRAAADRVTTVDPLELPQHLHSALSPHVAAVIVQAMGRYQDERYPDVASFKAALAYAETQPFQPGTTAPLPGRSSAGAPTLMNAPPTPAPIALRDLWQQANLAYVLEDWAQAEALLTRIAALNPQYEDVQRLLAEASVHAGYERGYAQMQALRDADAWPHVLDLFAKLPPNFPDPQGHRPWATARQRRDQHYDAALHAGTNKAWREMLDHLTKLLAAAPGDVAATRLQAHAQAKWEAIQRLLPAMVEVPAGPFLMGSSDHDKAAYSDEKPQHTLTLPRYWIGKTPITNAQFRQFVESDGYTNQAYWTSVGWQWREAEQVVKPLYWDDAKWNGADYPVVGVSWFEAVAYCRWLSQQTGLAFRLPTEAEWEKAARGPDGLLWPWGNTWDAKRANSSESGLNQPMPVGQYPDGASPYGALDMAGNAWEWCATKWGKPYPYQLEDEWQAAYLRDDTIRVIRGGSWDNGRIYVRGAYRYNYSGSHISPRDRYSKPGLRVASSSAK